MPSTGGATGTDASAGNGGASGSGGSPISPVDGAAGGSLGRDAAKSASAQVALGWGPACAVKSDGTVWWRHPCKASLVQVSALGTSVVEVAAGGGYYAGYLGHTCARKSDGTLWCWGSNIVGQLGDGTIGGQSCVDGYACLPSPAQVAWMCPSHSQSDGSAYACNPSPTQVAALGTSVVEVAAGALNTCAQKTDGSLWCWGSNGYAQIGDGTTNGQSCYDGAPCKPSPTQTVLTSL